MAFRDTAQGLLGGVQRFSNGVSGLLFPGFGAAGVDPRAAQAARAQAMMQMGAGLLGGQNAGQAYGLGQAAGWEPIEQARREAALRAATEDRKSETEYRNAQLERQQRLDQQNTVNQNRDRMYRRFDNETEQKRWEADHALRRQAAARAGATENPASVREFQYFQSLPDDQKEAYLRLQGGGAGGIVGAPKVGINPMNGQPEYFATTRDGQVQWLGNQPIDPNRQQAAAKLPSVQASLDQMYSTVDAALQHPGLPAAVGIKGPTNYLPGTEAQGFIALSDQIQGQAFLQAFESLKGGGQITQVEGEKATAAIARLSRAQSEKDYRAALNELKGVIERARKNASMRATYQIPAQAPQGAPLAPAQSKGADFYY